MSRNGCWNKEDLRDVPHDPAMKVLLAELLVEDRKSGRQSPIGDAIEAELKELCSDELPKAEIAARMERAIKRAFATPKRRINR